MSDRQQPYHLGQELTIPCECSATAKVGCSLCDGTGARVVRLGTVTTQLANLAYAQALAKVDAAANEVGVFMFGLRRPDGRVNFWHGTNADDETDEDWQHYDVADSLTAALLSDGEAD